MKIEDIIDFANSNSGGGTVPDTGFSGGEAFSLLIVVLVVLAAASFFLERGIDARSDKIKKKVKLADENYAHIPSFSVSSPDSTKFTLKAGWYPNTMGDQEIYHDGEVWTDKIRSVTAATAEKKILSFEESMKHLLVERGFTSRHLAQILGVTYATIRRWAKSEGKPSAANKQKIDDLVEFVSDLDGLGITDPVSWLKSPLVVIEDISVVPMEILLHENITYADILDLARSENLEKSLDGIYSQWREDSQ